MPSLVRFNRDGKFDLQLSQALIDERRLAEIFTAAEISRIELKSESWQWERTGNICIEYEWGGRPSGVSTTRATFWVHELKRDGATLGYFMFPVIRLRELVREARAAGRCRDFAGDDALSSVALLNIKDLLK